VFSPWATIHEAEVQPLPDWNMLLSMPQAICDTPNGSTPIAGFHKPAGGAARVFNSGKLLRLTLTTT
jgi:hypothetical protein